MMAFGINKRELREWKNKVSNGKIAFLTHYWKDKRIPGSTSVTKVGCNDIEKLVKWGKKYNLQIEWIHRDDRYPHFDLFGEKQYKVLKEEKIYDQIRRFNLSEKNTSQ